MISGVNMLMKEILKNTLGDPHYNLRLPWPPTVNHYHQPVIRNGKPRIIKSASVREYLDKTYLLIYRQMISELMIPDSVIMQIDLHPKTLASYDVDNRAKAVLDALSRASFWIDDDQCQSLLINKCEKEKGGGVEIFIWRC